MSKSDDIRKLAEQYNRIEKAADSLGRVIGVKLLRPSQRMRIQEISKELSGDSEIQTPDGPVRMSDRAPLIIAASVCEIDGDLITFPRNRAELDAILDRLDQPGLLAAAAALAKFDVGPAKVAGADDGGGGGGGEASVEEQLKNSPGTPG